MVCMYIHLDICRYVEYSTLLYRLGSAAPWIIAVHITCGRTYRCRDSLPNSQSGGNAIDIESKTLIT